MPWLTPAQLRAQWANAPQSDAVAQRLLDTAKDYVLSLAPKLAADATVPASYETAQAMAARKLWEQQRVNIGSQDDEIGLEGMAYRAGSALRYAILDVIRPPRPPIGVG